MRELKWILIGSGIAIVLWILLTAFHFQIDGLIDKGKELLSDDKEEKILVMGRANSSLGLDPAVLTDHDSFKVTVNIYDNLVRYDDNSSKIVPSLAESWNISENGLIWQFKIRKNVFFHDGSPLNAKAIAFNFTRWMDESSPYHTGYFTYWNMSFGGFPGIVEQVTALSDEVLEIRLKEPYSPFLNILTMPAFGIASPDAIMTFNENLKQHPVGSGPFVFQSWRDDDTIVLERNDNYWGEKAKVDKVMFKTIANKEERLRALKSGKIHVVDLLTKNEIEKLEEDRNISLISRPYFNIGYLSMNMNKDYFKLREVRRAVGHLFDRDKMMTEAFDELAKSANSFLPPVIWGHNETIKALDYDVYKAKKMLQSVGLSDGFELELLVMDLPRKYFPRPIALAEYIKSSLSKANIEVKLSIVPWAEVIKRRNKGDYDMVLAGWNGDIFDPDNFLYTIFASENLKQGVSRNYSYYRDSQVDILLNQARQATDRDFRANLYRTLQELIHEDTPAIPLVHTMTFIGVRKNVIGYIPSISGQEVLNKVYIENGE
ncbi:ABC transporter substrate-binding protein [Maledivibacter halophilus]|uniref:Peptide/nickel transport system substrate-binding protein n=1 Tax=Maledivibacter halophilus TaxID=36842 RepID=A0A1T5JY32_9FIRM|nr:ABC transporter substrate-binding protein [Maledivibacter halophilus]SKC56179.1 peptide/nickel transport system substrate-binding protein [Maledivibacter halophilus]